MYAKTEYYVPNNEFAPTNFYDVAPRVSISPTDTVRVEYYYSFLWRYSERDAVYTGAPWPGAQGQNSYAVTALVPGKPIGQQSDLRLTWTITPHVLTLFEFGIFWPGSALRTAGGRTTTFLDANLTQILKVRSASLVDSAPDQGTISRAAPLMGGIGCGFSKVL